MGRHNATPIAANFEQMECRDLARGETSARATKSRTAERYEREEREMSSVEDGGRSMDGKKLPSAIKATVTCCHCAAVDVRLRARRRLARPRHSSCACDRPFS